MCLFRTFKYYLLGVNPVLINFMTGIFLIGTLQLPNWQALDDNKYLF